MRKEKCLIKTTNPFFKGHVTREKLLKLIELKEKEGWKYKGKKSSLGRYKVGAGLAGEGSELPKANILATLEREKK